MIPDKCEECIYSRKRGEKDNFTLICTSTLQEVRLWISGYPYIDERKNECPKFKKEVKK